MFTAESDKLDAWADDQRASLEQQLAELQRRIKEVRTRSKGAATLAEKLSAQRDQRDLEALGPELFCNAGGNARPKSKNDDCLCHCPSNPCLVAAPAAMLGNTGLGPWLAARKRAHEGTL